MTRENWESTADRMLASARRHAGGGNSLLWLPGPISRSGKWSDAFEGFARTFLLASFRIAGNPSTSADLAQWYAEGIRTGTDPASGARWPRLDEIGQARCESCSIALGLHLTRGQIWDRFDDRTRDRVIDWLRPMVGAQGLPPNNWLWFQLIVESFLKSVGGPYDSLEMNRDLARIESWYRGDGWYSDGDSSDNFDYYSGWAMQFLPFAFSSISGSEADDLLQLSRQRLRQYLEQAQHLVGSSGAPVAHGRSVTYRFALLAPFWAGAIHDATPLRPGQTRRLAASVLDHFLTRSAVSEDGLLTIGWHHEFEPLRQSYTGSGSPYWAAKGFAGLLLPPTHPVWQSAEEPTPAELEDQHASLRVPGWLISSTAGDGIVRLINHGGSHQGEVTGQDDPWYDRFAYSSHAAPNLGGACGAPVDSHVALVLPDGRATHRAVSTRVSIGERTAVSRSFAQSPPPNTPDTERLSVSAALMIGSVVRGPVEIRVVRADALSSRNDVPSGLRLRVGGYALAASEQPPESDRSVVRTNELVSAVRGLHGLKDEGSTSVSFVNAFGQHSVTPWVRSSADLQLGRVYAAAVLLTGDPELLSQEAITRLWNDVEVAVSAQDDGHLVSVRWTADEPADTVFLPGPARFHDRPDAAS